MEERERQIKGERSVGWVFLLSGVMLLSPWCFGPGKHPHTHTQRYTAWIMQFSAAHACCRFPPSSAAPATTTKTAKSWFNTNSRVTKAQMGGETEWKELSGVYRWTNAFKCKLTYSTVAIFKAKFAVKNHCKCEYAFRYQPRSLAMALKASHDAFLSSDSHGSPALMSMCLDQRYNTSWKFYPIWSA